MSHRVLLIAPDDRFAHARLSAVLHRARCRVTLLGKVGGLIARSRYIDERLACPIDPAGISGAVRAHLAERRGRYRWVVVADEPALGALAAHRGEEWLDGWFPVDHRSSVLDICLYKTAFVGAAAGAGITVPASRVCRTRQEAMRAGEELGYPAIVKARVSAGGVMVRRADDGAQLAAAFGTLVRGREVVVQRFIAGRLGATEMLMDRGELVCWCSYHSLCCWEGPFGPCTARWFVIDPRLEEIARRLGRLTGFHGLCGMDWIHDPAAEGGGTAPTASFARTDAGGRCAGTLGSVPSSCDAFQVLEFNARPTAGYHLGGHSNIDFARGLRAMLSGRASAQRPSLPRGAAPIVYTFPHHVARCLEAKDYGGLRHWLPGAALHDVPWDDPRLLLQHVPNAARNLVTIARALASAGMRRRRAGGNDAPHSLSRPLPGARELQGGAE